MEMFTFSKKDENNNNKYCGDFLAVISDTSEVQVLL